MIKPTIYIMCGLPASGKTNWAKTHIYEEKGRKTIWISSDNIRKEIFGDENYQGNNKKVFNEMHKRTLKALDEGNDVIYDATNINRKDRAQIISVLPKYVRVVCIIAWTSIEECIRRDKERKRTVGKDVINKMLYKFQAPYYDEGFDSILAYNTMEEDADHYLDRQFNNMNIPHDNHHHSLDIATHCNFAFDYLMRKKQEGKKINEDVVSAAIFHDIGKPYVKRFSNYKGEKTDEAHYYQHQCVGAWISYGIKEFPIYSSWLISNHMDMFFDTKYFKKLPSFMKKDLELLHEADLAAH